MNMIDSGKDSLIDNDNNSLTNSKVTDRAISITYKDKEKDELKRETSLIGIMHEEKKRQNINNIKDKEIIKKGMVKEMKEMFERQDNEKLRRKTKDMPKENSAFKESLRRKLDTKDEIGKVNKGMKNNNDNLKEKANSDSVVKVKMEVVNKKDKKCNSFKEKIDERLKLIERSIMDTQTDN